MGRETEQSYMYMVHRGNFEFRVSSAVTIAYDLRAIYYKGHTS